MTREKILHDNGWSFHSSLPLMNEKICNAMEQYARQEAIGFQVWLSENYYYYEIAQEGHYSIPIDKLYSLYLDAKLKSKQ